MSFSVKILGSNSATPAYGRHHTSQFVTIAQRYFLVDCGEGTQIQMQKFRCHSARIQHILISHLHGDHYLGLMGLLFTFHLMGRKKTLHLYGQKGLQDIISLQLKYSNTHINYPIQFHQLDPDSVNVIFEDNQVEVTSFPLNHRIPCCGFLFREKTKPHRINKEKLPPDMDFTSIQELKKGKDVLNEDGTIKYAAGELTLPPKHSRSYAYMSDTAYNEQNVPLIKEVDMLYHEATFLNVKEEWAHKTFHSTTGQAGRIASKAGVKKLLIGHFSARYKDLTPFLEEVREIFPESYLAIEGETHELQE